MIGDTWGHTGNYLQRGIAHGIVRGILARVQGGNFSRGFMSAFASVQFGRFSQALRDTGNAARTAVMALLGGVTSELTGGKFGNGALSGAFVHLFNNERAVFTLRHSKPYYEADEMRSIKQMKALAISKMSYKEVLLAKDREDAYGAIATTLGVSAGTFSVLVVRYGYKLALEIVSTAIIEIGSVEGRGKLTRIRPKPIEKLKRLDIRKIDDLIKQSVKEYKK